MGTVPRIGLRRTQAVDDLLNGIWELRPELKRKNTTTILLGLEAFLRECKVHSQSAHSSFATVDSTPIKEASVTQLESTGAVKRDSSVSDDVEW